MAGAAYSSILQLRTGGLVRSSHFAYSVRQLMVGLSPTLSDTKTLVLSISPPCFAKAKLTMPSVSKREKTQ